MIAESCCTHFMFYGGSNGVDLFSGSSAEFYHQYSPGITFYKKPVLTLLDIVFRAFENIVIDELTRTGMVLHRDQISPQALIDTIKMYTEQSYLFGRKIHHIQFDLCDEGQCAFGTGNEFAKVKGWSPQGERCSVQQHIHCVACIPSLNTWPRKFLSDLFLGIDIRKCRTDMPMYFSFQSWQFALGVKGIDVKITEFNF